MALLVTLGLSPLVNGFRSDARERTYAEVYINGSPVSDRKQALAYAERERRETLRMMDEFVQAAEDSLRLCLGEIPPAKKPN